MCAGGHAVRAAWTLRHGLLMRAGLTVLSANTCGAGHLLTRHLLKRDIQSCGACGSGALRVRAPFHACRRQRREMHREGGCATGSGRACGASSAPTPHGLLTRAAILMMIVLSNVQAQGRRDETRPDERDGSAWPPRRGLPTRAARAPRRGLLTRHVLCCHKVRAVSQLRHATDVETFASVINPSSGPLCTVFRVAIRAPDRAGRRVVS